MLEMVEARRNGDKVAERYDLFSGLLDAARDEPDKELGLNDEELRGWYSTLQSFGILVKRPTPLPRKHVHLSYSSGKPEKYLTCLAGLFPAYSENKPVKNGDHSVKPH
jgi:hypothetical protein